MGCDTCGDDEMTVKNLGVRNLGAKGRWSVRHIECSKGHKQHELTPVVGSPPGITLKIKSEPCDCPK